MDLIVDSIKKEYSGQIVLDNISFTIKEGERVGLIGQNGSGKTTLLKIIAGLERPDAGKVMFFPSDTSIGIVPQVPEVLNSQTTVFEFLTSGLAADTTAYDIAAALNKLAIGDLSQSPMAHISSGQRAKVFLARALVQKANFLVMDEPTNHLDIKALEWLENYLSSLKFWGIFVSHDRWFLNKITNKIIELKQGNIAIYGGTYDDYKTQKEIADEANRRNYVVRQKRVKSIQNRVDSILTGVCDLEKRTTGSDHYQRRKAAKAAKGALAMVKKLERETAHSQGVNPEPDFKLSLLFKPKKEPSKTVVYLKNVFKTFAERIVLNDFSLLIRSGERVALTGPNGSGKTTILKIICGEIAPEAGTVEIGNNVEIGYLPQENQNTNDRSQNLDSIMTGGENKTLIDNLLETASFDKTAAYKLGRKFLFSDADLKTPVKDLSSGQKSKLQLAKILASGANFIILDEPTNHLDIPSREALEEAIASYTGTLLVVSHDRYFLERIKPNRVITTDYLNFGPFPSLPPK